MEYGVLRSSEIINCYMEFYDQVEFYDQIIKSKYEDTAPSRRKIAEWLALQEVNQLYHPSKGKAKDIKSSVTTPNTILTIDLMNK